MQKNYLQNTFEWYNSMKLYDTTHEYSTTMRTSVSNQILKMLQGLKSKFTFFSRHLLLFLSLLFVYHWLKLPYFHTWSLF